MTANQLTFLQQMARVACSPAVRLLSSPFNSATGSCSTAMNSPYRRLCQATVILYGAIWSRSASAGMPTISLTDIGRLRFSSISFFLLLLLVCTVFVQRLWNRLGNDFSQLPRLSFRGALAGVTLWGLMFIIVLTMISGARELMTPGAWVRTGFTSQLASQQPAAIGDQVAQEVRRQLSLQSERQVQLHRLWLELKRWCVEHDGLYPTAEQYATLPAQLRLVPGDLPAEYVYRPPVMTDEIPAESSDTPLVIEPAIFSDSIQLALYQSGVVAPVESP